jgi:hypothetical protein
MVCSQSISYKYRRLYVQVLTMKPLCKLQLCLYSGKPWTWSLQSLLHVMSFHRQQVFSETVFDAFHKHTCFVKPPVCHTMAHMVRIHLFTTQSWVKHRAVMYCLWLIQYCVYSNARGLFSFKFGAQTWEVIINLRTKHWTTPHQTALNQTMCS